MTLPASGGSCSLKMKWGVDKEDVNADSIILILGNK